MIIRNSENNKVRSYASPNSLANTFLGGSIADLGRVSNPGSTDAALIADSIELIGSASGALETALNYVHSKVYSVDDNIEAVYCLHTITTNYIPVGMVVRYSDLKKYFNKIFKTSTNQYAGRLSIYLQLLAEAEDGDLAYQGLVTPLYLSGLAGNGSYLNYDHVIHFPAGQALTLPTGYESINASTYKYDWYAINGSATEDLLFIPHIEYATAQVTGSLEGVHMTADVMQIILSAGAREGIYSIKDALSTHVV